MIIVAIKEKLIKNLKKVPKNGNDDLIELFHSYFFGIKMLLTPAQLRAARGLLDWTRSDLAKAAQLSPETIKNIEHGAFKPQDATASAIVRAFAAHDVEFMENEGVRKSRDLVKVFTGKQGFCDFLDHVVNTLANGNPVTRHLALSDNYAGAIVPEYIDVYVKKMAAISHLDAKCLIWEGDQNMPYDYCQYRWIKAANRGLTPFYVYDKWVCFIMKMDSDNFMDVSIYSEMLSKSLMDQFETLWDKALPPKK